MLTTHLLKLGFNQGEAKLYSALLSHGPLTATELAQKTDLGRTNVYNYAKSLQDKNLVNDYERNSKVYFQAADPKELYTMLDIQKKELNSLTLEHLNLLPRFSKMFHEQSKSPQVKFYLGKSDWKKVMKKVYVEHELKEIFVLIPDLDNYSPPPPVYQASLLNKKTFLNLITNKADNIDSFKKRDSKRNRKTTLVSTEILPIETEMVVLKRTIFFGNFDQQSLEVFSIENKYLTKMLSSLLKFASLTQI